jgi:hypothetical protein
MTRGVAVFPLTLSLRHRNMKNRLALAVAMSRESHWYVINSVWCIRRYPVKRLTWFALLWIPPLTQSGIASFRNWNSLWDETLEHWNSGYQAYTEPISLVTQPLSYYQWKLNDKTSWIIQWHSWSQIYSIAMLNMLRFFNTMQCPFIVMHKC